MYYNEYNKNTYIDTNECTSRGVCSVAPNIAALQELILFFLKQAAYYILNLEKFGASNDKIKLDIINDIASLVSINEFSENHLYSIVIKDYYLLENAKKTYAKLCSDRGLPTNLLKESIKFAPSMPISKAIALGEKVFLGKYNKLASSQKNLISILLTLVKSNSINLIKLNDFEHFDNNTYHEILETLNLFNYSKFQTQKLKNQITKLAQNDNKLQLLISKTLLEHFGDIEEVEVSHSTRKGKAILVSGNNFFDLMNILEKTQDKDIDVYTHSNLLITHALCKFRQYEHLRGHYGDTTESCILDFATFPGAILLTKNSRNNSDYLYRGRLFSNDYIVNQGVIKIEDNDFSPVIESALSAKGFAKGKSKENTCLGYNASDVDEKLQSIVQKLETGEISRLFIIGMNAYSEVQKEYFREFFARLDKHEFALSFGYESKRKNVLTINLGNYTPLATNILHKLFDKYPITSERVTFFFTECDVMTISGIVMLKSAGAKNIFMAECPPTLINPSVFDTFKKEYEITETTSADADIIKIREK